MKLIIYIVLFASFFSVHAEILNKKTLLNFDNGSDKNFEGWNYSIDLNGFGAAGWKLENTINLGVSAHYLWGDGPRSINKTDYGFKNSAIIDKQMMAPSSAINGGSFKVYETELSTDHRSTWWVWYDGKPMGDRGIADSNTNRMSFYLYATGLNPRGGGKTTSIGTNFHIGTYLCWSGSGPAYGTGEGCPYEGPGNQHYYHYLTINGGAWIHVQLDQHPTHKRGLNGNKSVINNPAFISDGKNYFEQMSQFYMEIRSEQDQKTAYWLDEIEYFYQDQPENEESITSLWVGYWSVGDYFEVGFQDTSFAEYNGNTNSTFEIRWSADPITNSNFDSANRIKPLFYAGDKYSGDDFLFRRAEPYRKEIWTRFAITDDISNLEKIYFAVKDVSVAGAHIGTSYPWNRADGHDSPTNNIKTIDLTLSNLPKPPSNLIIN